jgi:hypothetical protein
MYSEIVDDPLDAVARAIRVAMTRALDCDANNAWIAAHALAAVSAEVVIWEKISFDKEVRRKFNTV